MFDIGFWEICLIGLVSLLVIGPEKLPKVARVAGFWVGKTRHMVAVVKEEIKEEFKEEELRQLLQEQQAKIDSIVSNSDLNDRVEHFLDAKKEQTDKEQHGGE